MNIDRWLKRLWLLIGIVVLPMILYAAVSLVGEWLEPDYKGPSIQVADSGAADSTVLPRAIRFGTPERVFGSATTLVPVQYGTGRSYSDAGLSRSFSVRDFEGSYTPIVNVIVLSPNEPKGKLLLDQPAFVRSISFPKNSEDSLQTWIAYNIAFQDTNGDHRLDSNDESSLYVTDLNGQSLTRALPEGQAYFKHGPGLKPGTVLVYSFEIPTGRDRRDPHRWRQRAFEYSLETRTATPSAMLENPAARAAQILSK